MNHRADVDILRAEAKNSVIICVRGNPSIVLQPWLASLHLLGVMVELLALIVLELRRNRSTEQPLECAVPSLVTQESLIDELTVDAPSEDRSSDSGRTRRRRKGAGANL
jgi:hypothetical protein